MTRHAQLDIHTHPVNWSRVGQCH